MLSRLARVSIFSGLPLGLGTHSRGYVSFRIYSFFGWVSSRDLRSGIFLEIHLRVLRISELDDVEYVVVCF